MARIVLKNLTTEDALFVLERHGVIRDLSRRDDVMPEDKPRKPGWYFVNVATGDVTHDTTPKVRNVALGLQQNLNIVIEGLSGVQTSSGSRVFWPGDMLPQGIVVTARDGSFNRVMYPNTRVKDDQPDPLVEVILPDYERVVREGWVRRQARAERTNIKEKNVG